MIASVTVQQKIAYTKSAIDAIEKRCEICPMKTLRVTKTPFWSLDG